MIEQLINVQVTHNDGGVDDNLVKDPKVANQMRDSYQREMDAPDVRWGRWTTSVRMFSVFE